LDAGGRGELWRKTLVMLRAININPEKFSELENLVNKIKTDLSESMRLGGSQYTNNAYERQYLVAKLQANLEDLHKKSKELEELEKNMQTMCQRIDADIRIREQIREQLKKKLQIVVEDEKSKT
jgi:hypothetical protein